MDPKAEDAVKDTVENHSDKKESSEQEIDESVLDGYTTEDGQIAPEIVEGFRSNERNARLEAAKKLCQLATLTRREAIGIQAILNSGLSRAIVENVLCGDVDFQVQILDLVLAITGIGPSESVSALLAEGVIPKLIELASSKSLDYLRENALLVLGNIGTDFQPWREKIIQEGGLKPPLDILGSSSEYSQGLVGFAAHTIHAYTHPIDNEVLGSEVIGQILPVLCKYIACQNEETASRLDKSLCSLEHVFEDGSQVEDALKTDIVPKLVRLCASKEADTRHRALSCVGQIITISGPGTEALINAGILDTFKICIASEDVQDRKQACFATSNLVIQAPSHAEVFMDLGLVPLLSKVIMNQKEDLKARGDTARTLSILARTWGWDNCDVLNTLLEANALEAFCTGLTLIDHSAVNSSLRGIFDLVMTEWDGQQRAVKRVKAGDGIERLRAIRFRNDIYRTELHKMAQTILTDCFPEFSMPARM